jgi:hypothetical protein
MAEALNRVTVPISRSIQLPLVFFGIILGVVLVYAARFGFAGKAVEFGFWSMLPLLASLAVVLIAVFVRLRT